MSFDYIIFRILVIAALVLITLWGLGGFRVRADDTAAKCQALRDLNRSYRGRALSPEEASIKAQMVAWYRENCKRRGGRNSNIRKTK